MFPCAFSGDAAHLEIWSVGYLCGGYNLHKALLIQLPQPVSPMNKSVVSQLLLAPLPLPDLRQEGFLENIRLFLMEQNMYCN